MPQVHTYIRNEDMDAWKALPNKSEFIHKALSKIGTTGEVRSVVVDKKKRIKEPLLSIPRVVKGADFVPKPPDPNTGYPCCTRRSPCKHWQWSSDLEVYVNTLTGKEKEAN